MRFGNLSGRLTLFTEAGAVDVEKASGGHFGPDPQQSTRSGTSSPPGRPTADHGDAADFDVADLGAAHPGPGAGLRDRAELPPRTPRNPDFAVPDTFPPTFTKFRTALSGPVTTVMIPKGGNVDWEVELVAVIGRRADNVAAADAWSYVAGLTAGQDISERVIQLAGPAPQFSLGQVLPRFRPDRPVAGHRR